MFRHNQKKRFNPECRCPRALHVDNNFLSLLSAAGQELCLQALRLERFSLEPMCRSERNVYIG